MVSLKKKYENNPNVILCDSLQSIEYWFLLHFEDTCRHFSRFSSYRKSIKAISANIRIKLENTLRRINGLKKCLADSKMDRACELAEKYKGRDSYSEIYKAIKKVSE